MNWLPYPKDRKIIHKEGYSVIIPSAFETSKIMPLFCNICEFRFYHAADENAFDKFGCCSSCADQWAYSNKEKWLTGWRPSTEQVKAHIEKRNISDQNVRFI